MQSFGYKNQPFDFFNLDHLGVYPNFYRNTSTTQFSIFTTLKTLIYKDFFASCVVVACLVSLLCLSLFEN
ncbi:hypothetical protein VCRA213O314_480042 [Vibrio crassostreae]|nr:hypothetical protein VCRA213O314_480042 [Vibrio crassostreae]